MNACLDRRSALATLIGVAGSAVLVHGRTAAAATATAHEVEIRDLAFLPERLTVAVGDTVRWTNADLSPHTATADDQSWDTGELAEGESATLTITAAMTGAYSCAFHTHMHGTLVIGH